MNTGFLEFGLALGAFAFINMLWGWTLTMNTPPGLDAALDLKKMEAGMPMKGAKLIAPQILVAPKIMKERLVGVSLP